MLVTGGVGRLDSVLEYSGTASFVTAEVSPTGPGAELNYCVHYSRLRASYRRLVNTTTEHAHGYLSVSSIDRWPWYQLEHDLELEWAN